MCIRDRGITKEEQIDPGRELLNMLHTAVQANGNNSAVPNEQVTSNEEFQHPQEQPEEQDQQKNQQLSFPPQQQQPSVFPSLSEPFASNSIIPVSYTHLDVYKRQE